MIERGLFRISVFLVCLVACLPIGRALATLSLESSFSVTETYTDNLFFRANNKKSDFGTLFGPNLLLQYQNADVVLGAAYFGRVGLFVNNPKANRTLHNVNVIVDIPFLNKLYKGLTVNIDETLNATPQLDAFSGTGAQNQSIQSFRSPGGSGIRPPKGGAPSLSTGGTQGVFTNRANSFSNLAGLTIGYAWTPLLGSSLGYQNQYRQFSSNDLQDSLTHIATFSLPYLVRDGTSVIPSYSYRQTDFIGGSTRATAADRSISHTTQLGISHALSQTLSGFLFGGVGWTKQQGATQTVPGPGLTLVQQSIPGKWNTNVVGSAGISKTYRQGSISLSAAQNVGSGGGLASQATLTRTITGSMLHNFTKRLNGFGSIGYAQNKSIEGNALDTTTYRIQSGIDYAFLSWLSGNVSYSYINQKSKGSAASSLTVNQVFLGLTAFADPWLLIR